MDEIKRKIDERGLDLKATWSTDRIRKGFGGGHNEDSHAYFHSNIGHVGRNPSHPAIKRCERGLSSLHRGYMIGEEGLGASHESNGEILIEDLVSESSNKDFSPDFSGSSYLD